jgi:hypothetical protein
MNNKAEDGKYSYDVQIYTFLWFWFIILAAITGIFLIYRFFVVLAPGIRAALIQVHISKNGKKSWKERRHVVLICTKTVVGKGGLTICTVQ